MVFTFIRTNILPKGKFIAAMIYRDQNLPNFITPARQIAHTINFLLCEGNLNYTSNDLQQAILSSTSKHSVKENHSEGLLRLNLSDKPASIKLHINYLAQNQSCTSATSAMKQLAGMQTNTECVLFC